MSTRCVICDWSPNVGSLSYVHTDDGGYRRLKVGAGGETVCTRCDEETQAAISSYGEDDEEEGVDVEGSLE